MFLYLQKANQRLTHLYDASEAQWNQSMAICLWTEWHSPIPYLQICKAKRQGCYFIALLCTKGTIMSIGYHYE